MYTDPGYHHANPDSTDLYSSSSEAIFDDFLQVLGDKRHELLNRLKRREAGARTFDLSGIYHNAIWIGIKGMLEGRPPAFDRVFGLTYFFLYYFCRAYIRAGGAAERDQLMQRLIAAPLEKLGFSPLFFELAVAESFIARGHTVAFLGEKEGEKTPDLKIATTCCNYFIECKCRLHFTRPEFLSRHIELIATLETLAQEVDPDKSFFRLDFLGKRSVRGDCALEALSELVAGRSLADLPIANSLWELDLLDVPDLEANEFTAEPLHKFAVIGEKLQPGFIAQRRDGVIVAIYSDDISRIHETLDDTLKGAISQLPADQLRLVWIQVIGTGPQLANDKNLLHNLMSSSKVMQRVEKETKRNNGFVGFGVFADFELIELGDNLFRLNYVGSQVIPQNSDGNLYFFDLMKVLPSTVDKHISYMSSATQGPLRP